MLETTKTLWYLVEEALAELVHGALQLAALALPLLVVSHRLGCRPLPRGGSGVVVHIVEPAPLVHSFLPAARGDAERVSRGSNGRCAFQQDFINRFKSGWLHRKAADSNGTYLWRRGKRNRREKEGKHSEEADRE